MNVRIEGQDLQLFTRVLLLAILLFWSTVYLGQSGVQFELRQPSSVDKCDGRIKILSIEDCGVPGFQLFSSAYGQLQEGMVIDKVCPSEFQLSWSDSSGLYYSDTFVPNWGNRKDVRSSSFTCFDSTRYSPDILITGVAIRSTDRQVLENVLVRIESQQGSIVAHTTDSVGYYEFILPLFDRYTLSYSLSDHYTKKLDIDGRIGNEWKIGTGYSMEIDMKMIPEVDGLELTMLDESISTASWNSEMNKLDWDKVRAVRIAEAISTALEKALEKK